METVCGGHFSAEIGRLRRKGRARVRNKGLGGREGGAGFPEDSNQENILSEQKQLF